jgi:hypothetical protein
MRSRKNFPAFTLIFFLIVSFLGFLALQAMHCHFAHTTQPSLSPDEQCVICQIFGNLVFYEVAAFLMLFILPFCYIVLSYRNFAGTLSFLFSTAPRGPPLKPFISLYANACCIR